MRYRQNAKHSLDGNDLQMQSVAVTVCVIVTAARAKQLNARRGNSASCAWPRSNLIASRDHAGHDVDWGYIGVVTAVANKDSKQTTN